ncbi:MAG: hypothetical protein MK082_06835 [Phycisphaerales bacterium]|nr:hypothetical protein [Phycisphaerales bacterium]
MKRNRHHLLTAFLVPGFMLLDGCDRSPDAGAPRVADAELEKDPVGGEEPEAPAAIEWRAASSADGSHYVRWRPLVEPIPMADPFDVEVELFTDDSMAERFDCESIIVDAGMPHHGHGMNVRPELERRADGSWIARGMLMHMPGRWQVYVDVVEDGRLERTQWSLWLSG